MQRRLSYVLAFAWTFGATLVLVGSLQATVHFRPGAATDAVSLGMWEAFVYLAASFGVLRVHTADRSARDALGLRPTHPGLLVFGLALGVALQIPAESLRQLMELVSPTPGEQLAERAALLSADSAGRLAILLLMLACVVPLVEELFFRGALFTGLRRGNPGVGAAIITAVCFVASHPDWSKWPAFVLVAAVLSYLRLVSGSILPCIALHVGFNATTVALVTTGVSPVYEPLQLPWTIIGLGWLVSAGLVYATHVVGRHGETQQARHEDEG